MVKMLMLVGWVFNKYKLFCSMIYKLIFNCMKFMTLFMNGKNIEQILKSPDWQTTSSILFFFTNMNLSDKPEKDFPVKKFKIKWYIWVMYYVWAAWVMSKLLIYLFFFHLYNYLKFGLWRDLWLMLLEYWSWSLAWFNWALHMTWGLLFLWYLGINFMLNIHVYRTSLDHFMKSNLSLYKPIIALYVYFVKFSSVEKWLSFLGY